MIRDQGQDREPRPIGNTPGGHIRRSVLRVVVEARTIAGSHKMSAQHRCDWHDVVEIRKSSWPTKVCRCGAGGSRYSG